MEKEKYLFKLFLIVLFIFLLFGHETFSAESTRQNLQEQMMRDHKQTVDRLEEYYALIKKGDQFANNKQNKEALSCYQQALGLATSADGEVVARGALAKFFEQTSDYEAALKEVEWFLRRNLSALGRIKFEETKTRLLREIEEQKKEHKMPQASEMPAVSLSQSTNLISDFQKADYVSQKNFLEKNLPEETEILRLSKKAMLAEHAGKFAEAKGYYEQLLSERENTVTVQGEVAWPMLHCAVQRTAELTGDEAREKEMLVWIKANMLKPQGEYHEYLPGLLPDVQDHLKSRLKYFDLEN